MAEKKKMNRETLKNIYLGIAVTSMTLSACSFIFAFIAWQFAILGVVFAIVFVVSYKFARTIYKGYQIRYLFRGKDFKSQVQDALKAFNTTDEEFIERFKKSAKENYKRHGIVFTLDGSSTWVYRSDENIPLIKEVFKMLNDCVESKGGFVEFIEELNKKGYSGYDIYSYLALDILSNALYYLIADVFYYSDFCLIDIGLSDKFEEQNNAMKKRLTEVYSKILFEFEAEIKELAEKVAGLKEIEKLRD